MTCLKVEYLCAEGAQRVKTQHSVRLLVPPYCTLNLTLNGLGPTSTAPPIGVSGWRGCQAGYLRHVRSVCNAANSEAVTI